MRKILMLAICLALSATPVFASDEFSDDAPEVKEIDVLAPEEIISDETDDQIVAESLETICDDVPEVTEIDGLAPEVNSDEIVLDQVATEDADVIIDDEDFEVLEETSNDLSEENPEGIEPSEEKSDESVIDDVETNEIIETEGSEETEKAHDEAVALEKESEEISEEADYVCPPTVYGVVAKRIAEGTINISDLKIGSDCMEDLAMSLFDDFDILGEYYFEEENGIITAVIFKKDDAEDSDGDIEDSVEETDESDSCRADDVDAIEASETFAVGNAADMKDDAIENKYEEAENFDADCIQTINTQPIVIASQNEEVIVSPSANILEDSRRIIRSDDFVVSEINFLDVLLAFLRRILTICL